MRTGRAPNRTPVPSKTLAKGPGHIMPRTPTDENLRREADIRIAAARRLLSAAVLDWPGDPFVIAAANELLEQAQRFLTASAVDHWAVAA